MKSLLEKLVFFTVFYQIKFMKNYTGFNAFPLLASIGRNKGSQTNPITIFLVLFLLKGCMTIVLLNLC